VCAFVQGHDTFVSLPTGYGKSTIYAILPYVFDKLKGINIKAVDLSDLKGSWTIQSVSQSVHFPSHLRSLDWTSGLDWWTGLVDWH